MKDLICMTGVLKQEFGDVLISAKPVTDTAVELAVLWVVDDRQRNLKMTFEPGDPMPATNELLDLVRQHMRESLDGSDDQRSESKDRN